jgi:NADH-quinone oxidoreductase subunit L
VGGWINLPPIVPLGKAHVLDHWLDPVVGASTTRLLAGGEAELSHGAELALVGVAVAVAVLGIVFAFAKLKPARLVSKDLSPEEHGFEGVLAHTYFVDEAVDKVFVNPTVSVSRSLLWRGIDMGLIDGLIVNGSAAIAKMVSRAGALVQSGSTGNYAWAIAVGVLVLVGALTLR